MDNNQLVNQIVNRLKDIRMAANTIQTAPIIVPTEVIPAGITKHDLSMEAWREYDFGGRTYRIENPTALYIRTGGTTHRVLDADAKTVHCVPAPGTQGCVLRWQDKDTTSPVKF